MSKNPTWYFYTGILSLGYSIYAFANYYTMTGAQLIDPKIAKSKILNGEIKLVIDIRTKLEWNLGNYPNALHIPISELNKNSISKKYKNFGILVYCNTGQRARVAAERLKSYGFKKVFYIAGTYKTIM